jgi:biopolymer transport protein ExbB
MMEQATLGDLFLRGGWVMWPLLIFSILTWAVVFERAVILVSLRWKLSNVIDSLMRALRSGGDLTSAKNLCEAQKPLVADTFLGAMETTKGKDAAERVTERNRQRLMAYLKKNLWMLGTIASASPFIGLLGTVIGIVRAFHNMAEKGTGGFSVVAAGISEALIATAAGLVVAIVALLAYNIFMTLSNQTLASLKIGLEEILDQSFEKPHQHVG